MELRQLISFEAVARCGGFTRAADQLHIAQPAVSAQIRRLERELGVSLFARTTRTTTLTAAGRALLARVQRVIVELDAARVELDDLAGIAHGQVVLGATWIQGPVDLPLQLATFHIAYPGVIVTLRAGILADLLARLDTQDVDLVLGPIDPGLSDRFEPLPLVYEALVAITPTDHRLAQRGELTLSELKDEPFVALSRNTGLSGVLDAAAEIGGFTPTVQFEATNPSSIRELVSAGLGVALIGESTALLPGGPVSVHSLQHAPTLAPFGLIRRRDGPNPSASRALQHHLLSHCLPPQPAKRGIPRGDGGSDR